MAPLLRQLYIRVRARRIYHIRHERLLREHERDLHDAASNSVSVSTWTQDDIAQLAALTVARKLEFARRHVREVKQARRATKQLKARLAKGDTK